MKKQTLGNMIAQLRKEKGMTQLELAEKMGVTDKAVSKWERNLSLPDINAIPKLAEIFHLSIDDLMQSNIEKQTTSNNNISDIVHLVCKAIPLAMGVAIMVLSFINELPTKDAITMLAIGLTCLAITQFLPKD